MGIEDKFHQFGDWLETWPGAALTVVLLFLAAVLVLIALRGTALEKAIAVSWVVFP